MQLMERGSDRADERRHSAPERTRWWEWLLGESENRSYYSERMTCGGATRGEDRRGGRA